MNPKIYLGIDNCFASKRWAQPREWMSVIRDIGIKYIEASADTECDPMYLGIDFTRRWIDDVKENAEKTGLVIKNLYSGHGTYATCGLTHYDPDIRARFLNLWMKPQTDTAAALGAGFGFFAHGIEESILNNSDAYSQMIRSLYESLSELAVYAKETGVRYIGLEQMYSPHQPPWTIRGTVALLENVYALSHSPFYITLDLGHMNGQQYFRMPDEKAIKNAITSAQAGYPPRRAWFGSHKAHEIYKKACSGEISTNTAVSQILKDADSRPHLFSSPEDSDISEWVCALGRYSPIIHLQQSDGKSSPHWPFTKECNKKGIVNLKQILKDLHLSYANNDNDNMPPPCDEIVLTLEPFISTAGNTYDLLNDLAESVYYIRNLVPRDGMLLSEIIANMT